MPRFLDSFYSFWLSIFVIYRAISTSSLFIKTIKNCVEWREDNVKTNNENENIVALDWSSTMVTLNKHVTDSCVALERNDTDESETE